MSRFTEEQIFYPVDSGELQLPEDMPEEQTQVLRARDRAIKLYNKSGDRRNMVKLGLFPSKNRQAAKIDDVVSKIRKMSDV